MTTLITPCIFDFDQVEEFTVKKAFFHRKALEKVSRWILEIHNLKIEWHYSKSEYPYYMPEKFAEGFDPIYDGNGAPFVRFIDGDDEDIIGVISFTPVFDRYNKEGDDRPCLLTIFMVNEYDLNEDSVNHPANYGGKLPF
jgi:RimJ/RimL family protein N-acetyltransferase